MDQIYRLADTPPLITNPITSEGKPIMSKKRNILIGSAAAVLLIGIAAGCNSPAPAPSEPAPAATPAAAPAPATTPADPVAKTTDGKPLFKGAYIKTIRDQHGPATAGMTDDQLVAEADAICKRAAAGEKTSAIMFSSMDISGTPAGEAKNKLFGGYLAGAMLFCPDAMKAASK
jgi:hypothetical protein